MLGPVARRRMRSLRTSWSSVVESWYRASPGREQGADEGVVDAEDILGRFKEGGVERR